MTRVRRERKASIGSFIDAVQREALWPGVLLMLGGAGGTVVAHATATWPDGPTAGGSIARTAVLVVASLVALGGGAELVVTAERSPMRHVFVSDSLRHASVALVAVAALLVLVIVLLGCYEDLLQGSRVTARVVAGIGMLGGAIALLIVAGVARRLAGAARTGEDQEL